jgi:hypothetical protein
MAAINPMERAMPQAIVRFERLAYLSLLLGVLATSVLLVRDADVRRLVEEMPAAAIGTNVVPNLVFLALIFAAARRRQNWARWLYSVLVAVGLVIYIIVRHSSLGFDPVTLLNAASGVTFIASVYFVFSRPSSSWFRASGPVLSATGDRPN